MPWPRLRLAAGRLGSLRSAAANDLDGNGDARLAVFEPNWFKILLYFVIHIMLAHKTNFSQ